MRRRMSAAALELFLARLYTDPDFRKRFLADRDSVARAADLDADEVAAVSALEARDLELAAASFASKRKAIPPRRRWWSRLFRRQR